MFSRLLTAVVALSTIITATSALAITTSNTTLPSSPRLQERRYLPLPNPYYVPGTPIVLDFHFHTEPGRPMTSQTVTAFMGRASAYFTRLAQEKVGEDIPPGFHPVRVGMVELFYGSDPQYRMMQYIDMVNVLKGFKRKMESEGYFEREAIVLYRYPDGNEVETGEVDLGIRIRTDDTELS
ncbi:MAG: hypothetical protein Q9218_006905 [Villophora microphyllina]